MWNPTISKEVLLQLLQNFQVQVSGQANHREDIGLEDPANDQRIISRKYKSTLLQAMAHRVWKTEDAENTSSLLHEVQGE